MTTTESDVQVYKLKTEGLSWFQSWRKHAARRMLFLALLLVGFAVAFNLLRGDEFDTGFVVFLIIYLPFGLLPVIILSLLSYQRNIHRLEAYELHVTPAQIAQHIPGVPDLIVTPEDVVSITESSRYGIYVNTRDRNTRLVIWPTTEGYESIKAHLAQWQPIQTVAQVSVLRLPRHVITIVLLAAIIAVFAGNTPLVVIPAGLIVLGLMLYSLIETPRQSKVLRSERRALQLLFLVFILATIWRIIAVL